ncbi:MAG: transporter substrate-binding domain-containing protein [Clostridia bacterium]|nr:transporter substrate-binding domain-containing protein [Clostridia bacterium]
MKKIISMILCVAMVLGCVSAFTGCGDKDDDTLVMATNAAFPPYEYVDGDNGFAGIDVEIAQAIAEKLGKKLEIADVEFGSIIGGVQSGKYDFGMAGMTVTEDRKKNVDFSDTYATAVQVVIVKADSQYASFEDFYTGFDEEEKPTGVKEGIKIGVQQDTTGDIYSSDEPKNWGFGSDNVIQYKTGADAVQALLTDKVTAVIIDNEPAKSFIASNEGLKILDGEYANEDYAICVQKGNTELLDQINTALKELKEDGTIDKIVAKYIK